MAIDCGAERSGSLEFLFIESSFVDFILVGVDAVDLFDEFISGIFFVGRFGVVNCSVEFGIGCSLLVVAAAAAAACAF